MNYRGHGSVNYWGGNPVIFDLDDILGLTNLKPFVAVSADCLDGHYAYPPYEGIGESLVSSPLITDRRSGAVAHWGSSGLGISSDHTDILNGFYDAIFEQGLTALGDASAYAKLVYHLDPWNDPALIYSFNLQGDPATHLMRPDLHLEGNWREEIVGPGDQTAFELTVSNTGVYPAPLKITTEVPAGFSITSVSSTVASTVSISGSDVEIALQFGEAPGETHIPRSAEAQLVVNYALAPDTPLGAALGNFVAWGGSTDAWPGDEEVSDTLLVLKKVAWLPSLRR